MAIKQRKTRKTICEYFVGRLLSIDEHTIDEVKQWIMIENLMEKIREDECLLLSKTKNKKLSQHF